MNARARYLGMAAAGLLALALLGGCGGGGPGDESPKVDPAPSMANFPETKERTLEEIADSMGPSPLVASPAGLVYDAGQNRYAIGVFTKAKKQVTNAQVALYFAKGAKGKAIGPFQALPESLATPAAFRAQTTASDPDAATVAYVARDVNFPKVGEWRAIAVFRTPDGLQGTNLPSVDVGHFPKIPDTGDRSPVISTKTGEDVGGDLSQIDTRVPPDQMHKVDFADVVGKKPVVLLFATPQFCQSRTCGPVVDVAEQVREEVSGEEGADVAFIHQEVYNDNNPSKGIRPELRAFHLETEPWLFVIDRNGKVSSRFEGVFGAEELRQAIEKVHR